MSLVLVDVSAGVGTVTLNRPHKMNAFDRHTCRELIDGISRLAGDAEVRVLVLTGAGRAFSAGADLTVLGEDGPALVAAGKEIALLLRRAPQPVIAAINGPAAGGGANLALACDYRVASEAASIGQVFPRLGLGPDWGGSYLLPRLVGPARALELVWSARMVPAAEALSLGIFNQVVPAERLMDTVGTLAALWASFPALALTRTKEALYKSEQASLVEMLDHEIAMQDELFATPEARARLGASLATRSR